MIYRALQSIPVLGTVLYIVNSYVYGGDLRASERFAPPLRWVKTLGIPMALSTGLAFISLYPLASAYMRQEIVDIGLLPDFARKPGELILSVMPSLLGFGIGVYALLFAVAPAFVRDFHRLMESQRSSGKRKHGSLLMLSADMAYPLCVIALVLGLGVFHRIWPDPPALLCLTWLAFWYGLVVTIELIGVLFGLANQALLEKIEVDDKDDDKLN